VLYRLEWNTGRGWEPVGLAYRSLSGRRFHNDPVARFAETTDNGGPKQVVMARLRATPCPQTPKQVQRYWVQYDRRIKRVG
jgi:hypothetical protein